MHQYLAILSRPPCFYLLEKRNKQLEGLQQVSLVLKVGGSDFCLEDIVATLIRKKLEEKMLDLLITVALIQSVDIYTQPSGIVAVVDTIDSFTLWTEHFVGGKLAALFSKIKDAIYYYHF